MGKVQIKDGKINFCCRMNECQHSCCGPFSGITSELGSIDNRPFEEIVLTKEDYERFYQAGLLHFVEKGFSEGTGKSYYKMALEKDGTCKAFVDGRCTINNEKPTLCKAFPFYFDMFSGLCAIECEGFSEEYWSDLSNYEGCFEAAQKMYEFWIDFYSKKNK
ncbi:MAG: hypothetical protein IJA15_08360 [Clostridia bacterium]|nr:hypothetical protein [Clostridia bacterium]